MNKWDNENAERYFEERLKSEKLLYGERASIHAALAALRRTAEDDEAEEEYHTLPGKSICVSTCNGKRLTIVIDVEAALSERGGEDG